MGGRGSFSYSGSMSGSAKYSELDAYAVASLNTGIAKGTTPEAATDRFREQLMDKKYEYSAYVDSQGYIHSLGSIGEEGATGIAPVHTIQNERDVNAIIHNHPFGGSDGRTWGGPLSGNDYEALGNYFTRTGGKVRTIHATAREGIYSATLTKAVSQKELKRALKRADKRVKGKTFTSEKKMWEAVHSAQVKELSKLGINVTFTAKKASRKKLVTEKIGVYHY